MSYLRSYGEAVCDGRVVAGERIRRIYDRLLRDMDSPGRWHFDEERATRPWRFIEHFCRQSQGRHRGEPLLLQPFQKAKQEAVFGFVDDDGLRRFTEVFDLRGRKNGKTTETASVAAYMLVADGEGAPEIYFVATALHQSSKGFTECVNMRLQSPALQEVVDKRQHDLYCPSNFGFIKALASKSGTLDGLNGHFIVIDELAAIRDRDIYDLMKQSMGAREQPLLWEISTEGFYRGGIFDAQLDYAVGVVDGTIRDDRFLPLLYQQDSRDEWLDRASWLKSNPGLGTIKREDYLIEQVAKAEVDDTYRPTVMVKDFNIRESGSSAWLPWDAISNQVADEPFDIGRVGCRYGIGGLDAADSVDLCAATIICRRPESDVLYAESMYWVPRKKLEDAPTRRGPDDVPYDVWEARGLLRVVDGNRVDKRVVIDWFREIRDERDVWPLYIGYDPWHIDESLLSEFKGEFGAETMIPVRQGVITLSQPMKDLKAELEGHRVAYGGNPITQWCLANTYVRSDINGNIQPDKGRDERRRIDGTAALLDAWVVFLNKRDEYESIV